MLSHGFHFTIYLQNTEAIDKQNSQAESSQGMTGGWQFSY
jgi:hypothetical protein